MLFPSFHYDNPRIPVEFSFAGDIVKGHLTEVTGKKWWWFLHSSDKVFIDVLIWEGGHLRWQSGRKDLQAQLDYFGSILAAWYQ